MSRGAIGLLLIIVALGLVGGRDYEDAQGVAHIVRERGIDRGAE
jgi:hypothetical protein